MLFVLLVSAVVVVRTQVRYDIAANSIQVFDLAVLLLHMRNSHGSLVLVCSEWVS